MHPVPASGRNQEMISRCQFHHPVPLDFETGRSPYQKNPFITHLIIPESGGTCLTMGVDRFQPEGFSMEQ